MNKYKKLLFNTLLFGVASFSSKILSFVMVSLLTRVLGKSDYSTVDLVVNTCNFIVPIISLCIHEAVIRFGLESDKRKKDVYTTAMLTIFAGYLLLLLVWPLMKLNVRISEYQVYIYLYVFTSALRSTNTHFVRASGFVRIFALDGLLATLYTVGFSTYFLFNREMGVTGYLLGIILADALSSIGLILFLKLYRFFKPRQLRWSVFREMLRYSAPLVPTALFWWITNLSDHYLVDLISGSDLNGLYATAYKIPNIITLVSTIFIQAWQISAFSDYSSEEKTRFFSTIFTGYQTLVFLAASGLMLTAQPVFRVWVGKEFWDAWRYVPFLVLAVAFSCLVTFLGTIYNVAKSNAMVTVTTGVGAVINLILNLSLIPSFGPTGAAFATFVSYFVVFVIRAVDTRRYMEISMNPSRIAVSLGLLLVQVWATIAQVKYWVPLSVLVLILLVLCNLQSIRFVLRALTGKGRRRA